MRVRVVLAVLVALAVGVGAGWAVAASDDAGTPEATPPGSMTAAPVPASPSLPVEELRPDSDDATLETGLTFVPQTLVVPAVGDGPSYAVTLPTPEGWERAFDGVAKWTYTVPGNSELSYGLRVQVIADQGVSTATALRSRTAALESAAAQGNLQDLEIDRSASGTGFEASYVDNGYRRLSLEEFYGGDDPAQAFVTVAAFGREQDRTGLDDLLALVSRDLRTEVREPTSTPTG